MSFIVLVTGGRDHQDRAFVFATLDRIHAKRRISLIVCGSCVEKESPGALPNHRKLAGADRWALEWAWNREIDFNGRPARWTEDGYPQAGPMRNRRMFDEHAVDLVVAFSGGSGTENAVSIGRQRSIKLLRARRPPTAEQIAATDAVLHPNGRCTCCGEMSDDCAFCSKLCRECTGEGCMTCKGTGFR